MKRNASLREISTFARGSLIGSAITKGFGLRREITFNPKIRQFAFAKSGEPVGSHFARLAAKDLKATRALIARSESHVRNARRESSVLERMALDPNVPLKDVVHMATKLIHRGYFGALDYVFDAKSTIDGLRSRLKITPRNKERVNALLNGQIPLSISGGNVELNFRRKVLLRLANQFSKKEVVSRGGRVSKSIQQQQPFEKYTSEWYRRNYSASGGAFSSVEVTNEMRRNQIEKVRKRLGIKRGDLKGVMRALEDLRLTERTQRTNRYKAVESLVRLAKPGEAQAVRSLALFAGKSIFVDDETHELNGRASSLMSLAAENRGISRKKLIEMIGKVVVEAKNNDHRDL